MYPLTKLFPPQAVSKTHILQYIHPAYTDPNRRHLDFGELVGSAFLASSHGAYMANFRAIFFFLFQRSSNNFRFAFLALKVASQAFLERLHHLIVQLSRCTRTHATNLVHHNMLWPVVHTYGTRSTALNAFIGSFPVQRIVCVSRQTTPSRLRRIAPRRRHVMQELFKNKPERSIR